MPWLKWYWPQLALMKQYPGLPRYIDVCDVQCVKDILLRIENFDVLCTPPVFCYKSFLFPRHEVNGRKESQTKINSHIAERSGVCSREVAGWKVGTHGVLTSTSQEPPGQFAALAIIGWKQTIAPRAQKCMRIGGQLLFIRICIYKSETIWSYKHFHFKAVG